MSRLYGLVTTTLSLSLMATVPTLADNTPRKLLCSNGASSADCQAQLSEDALSLTLENGQHLTAKRLGRWKEGRTDGVRERSCNVRIDLGDDFVYGLLTVNAQTGTSLVWPQQRIDIRDLKE